MFCAYCGKELPEGAEFCTACGKAVIKDDTLDEPNHTENTIKNAPASGLSLGTTKIPKYIIWICLAVVAFFVLRSFSGKSNFDGSASEQTVIANAKTILCKDFVDPNSVSWNDEKIIEKDDYGRYLVYLDATATNGIGGRDRQQYYVIFRMLGDKYEYKNYGLSWSYANDYDLKYLKSRNSWGESPEEDNQFGE